MHRLAPFATAKVVKAAGIDPSDSKMYLSSDRQRPDADKSFEQKGSISYDMGNKKDKYFGDGTHFVKILVESERPVVARSESCALCTCVRPSSGCVGSKIHDPGHS